MAVPSANQDVSNYAGQLSQIQANTVWAARGFIGVPYQSGGKSKHGIDCSGLVHRILFGGFGPWDKSADKYFQKALELGVTTDDPQAGDVFFLDWASNPEFQNYEGNRNVANPAAGDTGIDHTGIVDSCNYLNDGRKACNIIHATSNEGVRFSKIVQNEYGSWDYYQNPDQAYESSPRPTGIGSPRIPATNLNFQFADSLKMRGLPSVEEVSHGQAIGQMGQAAQDKLGGVDLAAPFPLDSQTLGLGPLEAIRLSPDGQSLTLYAASSQPGIELHGVNPSDVLTILQSYARTGRAPSFTLLPDQQSSQQIQHALESASAALNTMGPLAPAQTGKILYGRQVWDYLGISNPSSFSMNAIFSDSGLQNTHAGEVLMASDLLLKTLALGHPDDPNLTPFLAKAAQMGAHSGNTGSLETSRFWFEADPSSFRVNTVKEPDGSVVWEFELPRIRVSCRPIQYGGISGVQDTAGSCAQGSLSAWYAEYLTNNIESLSQQYPVLKELQELYKASAVARLLHQKGVKPPVSDNSAVNPSWTTPSGADFLPVLYVSRPD
ncbi:MAG: C40 family peptidase, partial [Elusimicrobia bacterium]|nr:C40 family peptidase [Elusimicrobiota bacterium]